MKGCLHDLHRVCCWFANGKPYTLTLTLTLHTETVNSIESLFRVNILVNGDGDDDKQSSAAVELR